MSRFSESDIAERWLDRFSGTDREIATSVIDEVLLVSNGELTSGITRLFEKIQAEHGGQGPLAFYAEREVEWDKNQVLPIFPGARNGRAVGKGPQPIPFDPNRPEVGSEGLIANLITSYCRQHGRQMLNHPGPDLLLQPDRPGHQAAHEVRAACLLVTPCRLGHPTHPHRGR